MIHPLTVLTFAAFFGAGLYVFTTKEESNRLDHELRDIRRATEQERSRSQVLAAEWARLNDQDRLRSMAAAHLRELEPMSAAQFQRLEDALRRLPAPVAFQSVEVAGFAPRADAPSRPGEPLIVTSASLAAEDGPPRPTAPPVALAAQPKAAPEAETRAPPDAAPQPEAREVAAAPPPKPSAPVANRPAPPPAILAAATARDAPPRSSSRPTGEATRREPPAIVGPTPSVFVAQAQPIGSLLGTNRPALPPPVPYSR
jgi:hypothetical protein